MRLLIEKVYYFQGTSKNQDISSDSTSKNTDVKQDFALDFFRLFKHTVFTRLSAAPD